MWDATGITVCCGPTIRRQRRRAAGEGDGSPGQGPWVRTTHRFERLTKASNRTKMHTALLSVRTAVFCFGGKTSESTRSPDLSFESGRGQNSTSSETHIVALPPWIRPPPHLTFHPSGQHVYVINELNSTSRFPVRYCTGTLTSSADRDRDPCPRTFRHEPTRPDLKITPDESSVWNQSAVTTVSPDFPNCLTMAT